jgi:hypothetical protein
VLRCWQTEKKREQWRGASEPLGECLLHRVTAVSWSRRLSLRSLLDLVEQSRSAPRSERQRAEMHEGRSNRRTRMSETRGNETAAALRCAAARRTDCPPPQPRPSPLPLPPSPLCLCLSVRVHRHGLLRSLLGGGGDGGGRTGSGGRTAGLPTAPRPVTAATATATAAGQLAQQLRAALVAQGGRDGSGGGGGSVTGRTAGRAAAAGSGRRVRGEGQRRRRLRQQRGSRVRLQTRTEQQQKRGIEGK